MNYFIDTSIFLRFLVNEDKKAHKECANFLDSVKKGKSKVYVSPLVIAEIGWTLKSFYNQPKQKRIKALKAISGMKNIKFLQNIQPLLALDLYENNKIKLIDAFIASGLKSHKEKWVIVSYDKDFDKIGVERKTPADILLHSSEDTL